LKKKRLRDAASNEKKEKREKGNVEKMKERPTKKKEKKTSRRCSLVLSLEWETKKKKRIWKGKNFALSRFSL